LEIAMNRFQAGVSLYGLLLGAASLWILLAQFSSPGIRGLPTSPGEAAVAAQHRGEALWAARATVVRGDLWAEAAFTYANLEWLDSAQPLGEALDQARATATRAISLMPGNSGVWLMLADLSSRFRWESPSPTECLKMSYYTGPHEEALIPLRLMIVARLDPSADPVLADLFRRELQTVMMDRTALRPAIVAAYQQATSQAQRLIEDVAAATDPALKQTLRPEIRH
jgi:hypothetical protein